MISYRLLLFSFFFILFHLHAVQSSSTASAFSSYIHGPISLSPTVRLYFTVNDANASISLGIQILDPELPSSGPVWAGFGISEPTSGGMSGSDLATLTFSSTSRTSCTLTDRFVPFAAYPKFLTVGKARNILLRPDYCQEDGSWRLLSCARKPDQLAFHLERPLAAHDDQDRPIVAGENAVIVVYGSSDTQYNGEEKEVSERVVFFRDEGSNVGLLPLSSLPDDVDGNMSITVTGMMVSDKHLEKGTTVCTSKLVPMGENEQKMIVAFEPILGRGTYQSVVRMMVYACEKNSTKMAYTQECAVGKGGGSPLGSVHNGCSTVVAVYGRGGSQRVVLPQEAGFLLESRRSHILILETEYEPYTSNTADTLSKDYSGIRLYTTSKIRRYEAGSLQIGDPVNILSGRPVKFNHDYEFTCPTGCTSKFNSGINLIANFPHMGNTGMQIYINRFDEAGGYIDSVHKVNFWTSNHQPGKVFGIGNTVVSPGEQLQLTCKYDPRKRNGTVFGSDGASEGCTSILFYYPLQRDQKSEPISLCAYGELPDSGRSMTLCGDGSTHDTGGLVVLGPNPAFEDTHNAPTAFGNIPAVCEGRLYKDEKKDEVGESVEPGLNNENEEELGAQGTEEELIVNEDANEEDDSGIESTSAPTQEENIEIFSTPVPVPGTRACFPRDARVRVRSVEGILRKKMWELKIGDEVDVGNGEFSKVIMFTHREEKSMNMFLEIRLEEDHKLVVSTGHLVYTDSGILAGNKVTIGMRMWNGNGRLLRVVDVKQVVKQGLFNPQTLTGDIVVNDVVATCYTTAVPIITAHGLLAPVRMAMNIVTICRS